MNSRRRWTWAPMIAVVLAFGAGARAEDTATAEALFDKGVAAMNSGSYEVGCPALEESHRIDPRAGTTFTLAACNAKWGKVATAMAHYADYLRMVSELPEAKQKAHADRKKMAEDAMVKLKPGVPKLTLVLPKGAPVGTVVKRDGQVRGASSLGTALPVDPGEHIIVTQVPGGPEHEMHIKIGLGESLTVLVEIETAPPPPPVVVAPMTSSSATIAREAKPPPTPAKTVQPERRYVAATWITGGIGAAGIVVWGVTGLMAMSKKSTASDNCNGSVCSNQTGVDAGNSARTLGQAAGVGLGVGIAGLATGVVLYFVGAPSSKKEPARAWEPVVAGDEHGTSVGIRGAW